MAVGGRGFNSRGVGWARVAWARSVGVVGVAAGSGAVAGGGVHGGWLTDWPDSDLNFSFRLQQLTSLKVNPDPITLQLTDKRTLRLSVPLHDRAGSTGLLGGGSAGAAPYLLNGGFLMVDDFWGDWAWENFYREIKRVFPEDQMSRKSCRSTHEIFQCVYRLKEKPQVPSIQGGRGRPRLGHHLGEPRRRLRDRPLQGDLRRQRPDDGRSSATTPTSATAGNARARTSEYFHEFSEKKSYPMGINIVTYAMTH